MILSTQDKLSNWLFSEMAFWMEENPPSEKKWIYLFMLDDIDAETNTLLGLLSTLDVVDYGSVYEMSMQIRLK